MNDWIGVFNKGAPHTDYDDTRWKNLRNEGKSGITIVSLIE
jgi:hypothetical protein